MLSAACLALPTPDPIFRKALSAGKTRFTPVRPTMLSIKRNNLAIGAGACLLISLSSSRTTKASVHLSDCPFIVSLLRFTTSWI